MRMSSGIRNGISSNVPQIDDVDDDAFLNHPRQGSKGYYLENDSFNSSASDKRQQLLEEKRKVEERTLQSTKNSLRLIYETEKVGVQTAEELLHQREQLDNVNDKLDSINSIMRVSQKHLTSMKSMFGGFKNFFSKSQDKPLMHPPSSQSTRSSSVGETKLRQTLDENFKNPSIVNDSRVEHNYDDNSSTKRTLAQTRNLSAHEIHSKQIDEQLDNNLAEMGQGISRLKALALGLGNEIDSQNKLLDRIATKSERAQDTVANQNRQMNRILKG
ncbi:Soluble NSF attachment protein 29 [Sarcoptes scabiei]|uniref:Soluble NSF attachment protein 29 n=2 Tax=Sarcoptes scabiei TaxID=52283 RepID=A0A834REZ6_SARSC|nr:Soluble NSF attachment protein 29 [Sarcoptes scabiei]UXI19131.1 ribonuclease p protein subunit p29 [Sarcoptes scabiei]